MKIKLLNDGGYKALKDVKFPIVVSGFRYGEIKHAVGVARQELILAGADEDKLYDSLNLAFLIGEECEIVDE